MTNHLTTIALVVCVALAGCAGHAQNPPASGGPADRTPIQGEIKPSDAQATKWLEGYQLTQVVPLSGDEGLLLVGRTGMVYLLPNGSRTPELLLNITDRVSINGERGLSSLALHPDFEENGMMFLAYTKTTNDTTREGFSELTRYRADPADIRAPWERQDVLLRLDWAQWYHNTADLKFGPDGMLYVGVADGSRDRMEAQNLRSLNGSILRLDVDEAPGYKVPSDNPFVGRADARPEIWLYGFRNPWRMDFDPATGDLYIAHSGESAFESVHIFPGDGDAPRNHGWPYLEGGEPFEAYGPPPGEVNMPIVNYDRRDSDYCAVIGGNVYEGNLFPELRGKFVFADHCAGQLMFTQKVGDEWVITKWYELDKQYINSVDADASGELVISTLFGRVYKITPA